MLLKFDNALWNDIVADLSLEEYAALTATCRDAWKRPLIHAELAASYLPKGPEVDMSNYTKWKRTYLKKIQRASFVAKRSAMLRTLIMELGNTAGGICAFANDIRRAPHLQQLAIQMSPQWAATIAQAWKAPQPGVIGNYLATLREQTAMAELCLSTLSSGAPADLRTLAVIDDGNMHTVVPSFSALNHMSLDLCMPPISLAWVRELPQLQTLRLNVLVGHPWQLDLQPMADLAYVFIVGHLPDQLRLPELCQLHVGNTDNAGLFRVVEPHIKPWLTRMDITREQADPGKLALSELLGLDLHLDELMLRFDEIGSDAKPLAISASSG
ncbi:g7527 [Coccomyxa viridis]|uniref:G7527 protein n=1 Tax=Coccomyxa viridis TaxID=1274662 RepID=A0ABP1FY25_9CHLO